MSASWPSSVATNSTLYIAVNELQNNLSGAINNSVTTIGLNSTTGFPTVGLVLIDNEVIQYGGISGNNLTSCTRAFDGTTAASHSSGAVTSFAFCAQHHNGLKDEVIAVETYLDTVLGKGTSTTAAEFAFLHGVTSAIQTQMDLKAPKASPAFTGTIGTALTVSKVVQTDGSSNLTTGTETGTGSVVRATTPTLVTPVLGVAAATSVTFGQTALSWYEEGSFTPVLKFGGATTGITYGLQSGRFTRIGRMVQYEIRIILTSKGSATGQATITGAPYNAGQRVYAATLYSTMASTDNNPTMEMDTATWFPGNMSAGSNTGLTNTDFTNTTTMSFTGTYSL